LSQNNPVTSHEFRQQDAPRRQEKYMHQLTVLLSLHGVQK
jgi:hypothetical protein